MGTNYHYRLERCEHCQRSDVLHVGKQSAGWTFQFRAYRGRPDGLDIVCLADWEKIFKTVPGVLADEHGTVIQRPLKFLAELERPSVEQQELEDSFLRRGSFSPAPSRHAEWRDPEGFSFYDGKFS